MHWFVCTVIILLSAAPAQCREPGQPASSEELMAISKRGRILGLMQELKDSATQLLLTKKNDYPIIDTTDGDNLSVLVDLGYGRWQVAFGRLSADKSTYLIDFLVTGPQGKQAIKTYSPPLEDHGYFRQAARALQCARTKGDRGLSYLVLPLDKESLRFYVYFYPRAKDDTYLLGGDYRYKVIVDSEEAELAESKQLHQAILTYKKPVGILSYHTAILDEKPEDTDVLHVLTRRPKNAELVGTANYMYRIEKDGTIKYLDKIARLKQKPQ